jgi:Putative phage tail protein
MATLVLGVVGRAVLGPVGGLIGTLVGSGIDQRLIGGRRQAARAAIPEIQAASYGEPIPVVRGRMRVSGNVIWAAPVRETVTSSGGGKRGPSSTSYAYSASFAVLLCAGTISGVGRVWADGKLLRDAAGEWLSPVTMRLHDGSERQLPDPLIAAAETDAPAFRGLAHAVFEDLPLADFGNRLPNLAFEIIADAGPVLLGEAIAGLAARAGVALPVVGQFPAVDGLFAGSAGSLADVLGPVLKLGGAVLAGGQALIGPGGPALPIALTGAVDAQSDRGARQSTRDRQRRTAAASAPDAVEIGYYDVDRDYQPGLQRARLRAGERVDSDGAPVALSAAAAKRLCLDRLLMLASARQRRTLRLPWRYLGLRPGDVLALPDGPWRVSEVRFEAFVLALELVRAGAATTAAQPGDGGRALVHGDAAAGATSLVVMDLPPLPGELPDRPRLWLAGAGAAAGWRRAGVAISLDGGASYAAAGVLPAPVVMGQAVTALPAASAAGWDRVSTVDVELLADAMWLESRSEDAVLAGANLAVLGDELIQFAEVTALAARRFRLKGLLRGRRGSEWAVAGHATAERFVLLDAAAMLPLTLPLERLGEAILVRATGSGDSAMPAISVAVGGEAIRPLPPVHLRHQRLAGELQFSWIPQSRAGFGWPDLTDVPLGEAVPAWRVMLRDAAGPVASADVAMPAWATTDRPGPLWLDVAQLGATLGRIATLHIP